MKLSVYLIFDFSLVRLSCRCVSNRPEPSLLFLVCFIRLYGPLTYPSFRRRRPSRYGELDIRTCVCCCTTECLYVSVALICCFRHTMVPNMAPLKLKYAPFPSIHHSIDQVVSRSINQLHTSIRVWFHSFTACRVLFPLSDSHTSSISFALHR
jgi:hypothetical protein